MNISTKKSYEGTVEITVISAVTEPVTKQTKSSIEQELLNHVREHLYPGNVGLNFYQSVENDTASIVVIRNINDMKEEESRIYSLDI